MKKVWTGILLATLVLATSPAIAGIEFVEVDITSVAIPDGASPAGGISVSPDGDVVLLVGGMDGIHYLVAELGVGGTDNVLTLDESGPMEPTSASFGPGGDLLIRGILPTQDGGFEGVTARVTLEGETLWIQPDSAFSESLDYLGVYEEPAGPVTWSPLAQRVLIFTTSSFEVAPVSQGTLLFELNGDVRRESITFGTEYIGAALANVTVTPQGRFFIYYFSQNDRGARFFLFDGVTTIDQFMPEGGDWPGRIVYFVQYDSAGNLYMLWNSLEDESNGAAATLTKLDSEGKLLWESDLTGSLMVPDGEGGTARADLLRPRFMVVTDDKVVLLRDVGPNFYFDVRSGDDGSALGFSDFTALTENTVFDLDFLSGSDNEFVLSSVDASGEGNENQIIRVALRENADPVEVLPPTGEDVGPGPGADGGFTPMDAGNEGDDPMIDKPEVGCGCQTLQRQPTSSLPALALGALVLGALLRRRRW